MACSPSNFPTPSRCQISGDVDVLRARMVCSAAGAARAAGREFRIEWQDVAACDLGALQLLAGIPFDQYEYWSNRERAWVEGWLRLARASR